MAKKKDITIPLEDGVEEVVEVANGGKFGVELDHDVPFGPKKGIRYFDNKEDAKIYQDRFGGKLV